MHQHVVKPQRWPLYLIVMLFVIPYFIAYWCYAHRADLHFNLANKGQLLAQVKKIESLKLIDNQQQPVPLSRLKNHWIMLYISPVGDSLEADQLAMDKINRVRITLSRQRYRIEPILVREQGRKKRFHDEAGIPAKQLFYSANGAVIKPGYYIGDPNGNIILYYVPGIGTKALYSDLKRLLKLSQIG